MVFGGDSSGAQLVLCLVKVILAAQDASGHQESVFELPRTHGRESAAGEARSSVSSHGSITRVSHYDRRNNNLD